MTKTKTSDVVREIMKFWIEIAKKLIEWAFEIDIDCEFDCETKEMTDWII
jgi:hypothetical protein